MESKVDFKYSDAPVKPAFFQLQLLYSLTHLFCQNLTKTFFFCIFLYFFRDSMKMEVAGNNITDDRHTL